MREQTAIPELLLPPEPVAASAPGAFEFTESGGEPMKQVNDTDDGMKWLIFSLLWLSGLCLGFVGLILSVGGWF